MAAQGIEKGKAVHMVGIDVLRHFSLKYLWYRRSVYHFEVFTRPFYNQKVHPYLCAGAGAVRFNGFFTNVDYRCEGWFLRSGVEFDILTSDNQRLLAGFGFLYSHGLSRTQFVIPGNYFPDYLREVRTAFDHILFQPHLMAPFKIYKKLEISAVAGLSFFLTSLPRNSESRFSYFTPGLGFHRDSRFYPDLLLQISYPLP